MLTPTRWDPHSDAYAINEESMLDWEGNMKQKKDREAHVVLEEIPEDEAMVFSMSVGRVEDEVVDATFADDK